MAKGCHNSPAAKGWILTSPCLWSCDQQHLGDVAEVADTSVHAMSCNVTLRYVMLCYVILSLGFQPPLKPWDHLNPKPPWIWSTIMAPWPTSKELFGPRCRPRQMGRKAWGDAPVNLEVDQHLQGAGAKRRDSEANFSSCLVC